MLFFRTRLGKSLICQKKKYYLAQQKKWKLIIDIITIAIDYRFVIICYYHNYQLLSNSLLVYIFLIYKLSYSH